MGSRLDLHNKFIDILGTRDEIESRVYFDPPTSVRMKYPCIKYSLVGVDQKFADNITYKSMNQYEVTVIDYDPDSSIPGTILSAFPMCKFDRPYVADNLHHNVFTLYY